MVGTSSYASPSCFQDACFCGTHVKYCHLRRVAFVCNALFTHLHDSIVSWSSSIHSLSLKKNSAVISASATAHNLFDAAIICYLLQTRARARALSLPASHKRGGNSKFTRLRCCYLKPVATSWRVCVSVYVCVERENVRHFLREILPVIKSNMLVTFGDLLTSFIRVKLQREGRGPETPSCRGSPVLGD